MKAKKIMKVLKHIKRYCDEVSCGECKFAECFCKCPLKVCPIDYDIKGIKRSLKKMED